MSELIFRYSSVYNGFIQQSLKQNPKVSPFSVESYKIIGDFIKSFVPHWRRVEERVFAYFGELGFSFPAWWIAYPVYGAPGLMPFSDPLTFRIDSDDYAQPEQLIAILIHELCHIHLNMIDNDQLASDLVKPVQHKFAELDPNAQFHIIVNLITQGCLTELWGRAKADELLAVERELTGLKEAWAIIDVHPDLPSDPLEALKVLTSA